MNLMIFVLSSRSRWWEKRLTGHERTKRSWIHGRMVNSGDRRISGCSGGDGPRTTDGITLFDVVVVLILLRAMII